MRGWRWTIVLFALTTTACKRESPRTAAPPATQPVAITPATLPAKPVKATFFVGDEATQFPPAKLVFQPRDGDMRVVLMSDDPPAAVRDKYAGNSFYFDLILEKTTAADMDGAVFAFTQSDGGTDTRADTSTGLFIDNGRQTLSPTSAKISFIREGPKESATWNVRVQGPFQLVDSRQPDVKPQSVMVNAVLMPTVAIKE